MGGDYSWIYYVPKKIIVNLLSTVFFENLNLKLWRHINRHYYYHYRT